MVATTGHLTLKDIAELAEVSRPAVSNWRRRHDDFPMPVEESTPRKPLFEAAAVVAWLKDNDLLPKDAERELQLTGLWAVANLLRNEIAVDDIPLVILTLLALDKDPSFEPSEEFNELRSRISADTLEDVKQGIVKLNVDNHGEAARSVVDRFLGVGSRGDRSQYGTATSLSSATIVAAAGTSAENADTVLDPACGIAGTLLGVGHYTPEAQLFGVELHQQTATLARLLVHLTNNDATIVTGDSLTNDPFADVRANLIVCEPPLGMRIPREISEQMQRSSFFGHSLRSPLGEELFLLYAAQHLAADGHAYILTSMSPTFRAPFKEQRQRLTAEGHVEAVVELPAGLFSATRIPAVLWVLSSEEVKEPLLIDASTQPPQSVPNRIAEWLSAARNHEDTDVPYRRVTLADVVTNDGSLCPSTYLTEPTNPAEARSTFDAAVQSLEEATKELMHIRTPRVTADVIPVSTTFTTLGELIQDGHFKRINGTYSRDKDIETGSAYLAVPNRNATPAFVDDYDGADVLRPGDILMPRGGLSAWVHEDDDKTWVPSNMVTVLRPRSEEYDPYFIVACLNAPANIDTRGTGTVTRRHPLSRIAIPELNRTQRAVIADTTRALSTAHSVALQLTHEVEQTSDALFSLILSGK
ncbi:N-6 DNA methylase [uncultured Corynebacterium sp.]|uniref:N-6 DNA methylase n=1 Tax=uncultured Corynebacterium sp. TaxID=159447 RepID=UPI002624629F|nr:N-6 DNA methylase [uncultured Corynebacterium sp.]